ncbi:MAG TPA: prepilin peptidase [Sphingomicrobium sp.]|nr:prepilin peptidase [Sphingomicrobium sp.]
MNLVTDAPLWLAALLLLTLLAAVIEDASRLRISNITCLAVLVEALVAMGIEGFSTELWQNGVALLCVLAVGTGAFAARLLGGGDVKLLAALALWLDLQHLIWLVAAVFIAGGLVAVAYLSTRLVTSGIAGVRQKDRRIPYGIAIAAGAMLVFAFQRPEIAGSNRPLPPIKIVRPSK